MEMKKVINSLSKYKKILEKAGEIRISEIDKVILATWIIELKDKEHKLRSIREYNGDTYDVFIVMYLYPYKDFPNFITVDYRVEEVEMDLPKNIAKDGIVKVVDEKSGCVLVFDLANKKAWIEGEEE